MIQINPKILELLQIEDMPLKEVTLEQKKQLRERFTSNLNCTGLMYSEGCGLLFTNKESYSNWLYYAGFEYIKQFDLIQISNQFYAFYSNEHDRVTDLETIFS